MNHYGTHQLVTQLVDSNPRKAVDILTRCCEESKILEEVTSYLLQPRARQFEVSTPPANRFDITFAPPLSPSSHGSHHTGTPPPRQRLPRRPSSTTYPLSPPATASSVTSHSTRSGSGLGEYILLPTVVEGQVVEVPVRMKTASITYSVIRDDVVGKRNLEESFGLSPAEVAQVPVPHRVSGGVQVVPVSWSIDLTWRRPHSDSTHSTIFYLVPKEVIDVDMYLGYDDSGDGGPGVYTQCNDYQAKPLADQMRSLARIYTHRHSPAASSTTSGFPRLQTRTTSSRANTTFSIIPPFSSDSKRIPPSKPHPPSRRATQPLPYGRALPRSTAIVRNGNRRSPALTRPYGPGLAHRATTACPTKRRARDTRSRYRSQQSHR
jgi:hypothetical protein